MGMSQTAYAAYGVHIPISPYGDVDRVDDILSGPDMKRLCPDVGHLLAGDYDEDIFFLVTEVITVKLGSYIRVGDGFVDQEAEWDRQLREAIEGLGYTQYTHLDAPGWLIIPDCS